MFSNQSRKVDGIMENDGLQEILTILTNSLEKSEFDNDKDKIKYFCSELEKIKNSLPTIDKLEELQKIELDLEVKYDDFNDLSYYFDPLYIIVKNKIHDENIKKIREENRRKRGIK